MRGMIIASKSAKFRRTDKPFVNGASAPRIVQTAAKFCGLTETSLGNPEAYGSVRRSYGGETKRGDAGRTAHKYARLVESLLRESVVVKLKVISSRRLCHSVSS